jgi:hypothetical protein
MYICMYMDVKLFKQGEGPVNTLGIHVYVYVDIVIYMYMHISRNVCIYRTIYCVHDSICIYVYIYVYICMYMDIKIFKQGEGPVNT